MGKRRRTEIARIADPAARLVTYSKRRKGLFKKASELCRLSGARAAVIVFSPAGKPCSFFSDPSVEDVISDYIRGDGDDAVPPMSLTEWVQWMENEWNSCRTEEDVEFLIAKYETVRDIVRNKLADLEKKNSLIGSGGDSGGGFGRGSVNLSDAEIDLIFESFKARCPALFEDWPCNGDGDPFFTSPEKSTAAAAAAGRSLGVDSTHTCSHLEGFGFNLDNFPSVCKDYVGDGDHGGSSGEVCDLEGCGFNPDELLSLSEDCIGDGDRDSFFTIPENLAIGGGSSGDEELMHCDLEGCGFNPNEFLTLLEDFVGDGDSDSFFTLSENSAIRRGSSGEEPMHCDLEWCVD